MNKKEYEILQILNDNSDGQDFPKVYIGGEFVIKMSQNQMIDLNLKKVSAEGVTDVRHAYII